jgi:hypothetical protein
VRWALRTRYAKRVVLRAVIVINFWRSTEFNSTKKLTSRASRKVIALFTATSARKLRSGFVKDYAFVRG